MLWMLGWQLNCHPNIVILHGVITSLDQGVYTRGYVIIAQRFIAGYGGHPKFFFRAVGTREIKLSCFPVSNINCPAGVKMYYGPKDLIVN